MNHVLYLVRHCQATGQEPDAPLTETGQQQAIALANWLGEAQITRIISSPYMRAYQSIVPLAKYLGLTIEVDDRLIERVLCSTPLTDWREKLAETFVDLDLNFAGGESSRVAMRRGIAVVHEAMQQAEGAAAIVIHGNLLTLILRFFGRASIRCGIDRIERLMHWKLGNGMSSVRSWQSSQTWQDAQRTSTLSLSCLPANLL